MSSVQSGKVPSTTLPRYGPTRALSPEQQPADSGTEYWPSHPELPGTHSVQLADRPTPFLLNELPRSFAELCFFLLQIPERIFPRRQSRSRCVYQRDFEILNSEILPMCRSA